MINKLEKELKDLKEETRIMRIDCNLRNEAAYTFELNEFSNFIKSNRRYNSIPFKYLGISWHISVEIMQCFNKYLSFFLSTNFNQFKKEQWSIEVKYDLKIVNQVPGNCDKLRTVNSTYTKELFVYGIANFIDLNELTDPTKGYLKDDLILLQVCFKNLKYKNSFRTY